MRNFHRMMHSAISPTANCTDLSCRDVIYHVSSRHRNNKYLNNGIRKYTDRNRTDVACKVSIRDIHRNSTAIIAPSKKMIKTEYIMNRTDVACNVSTNGIHLIRSDHGKRYRISRKNNR